MQKVVIERLSQELNKKGVLWGIGGSHVLYEHGLDVRPGDVDLVIAVEDSEKAMGVLDRIAEKLTSETKSPYKTKHFTTYQIEDVTIDFMAGFAIEHDSGVYELTLDEESIADHKENIPYTFLEDWFVLYQLIPKKGEKADFIESYWKENGVENPPLLKRAFDQPLPEMVKQRIQKCLSLMR
ncbi:hypothetical protein [Bacillus sp. Marseille-Q3570]|uniref:hypothetical protein n=1 Tax=Bacillus sp. Marseille-Q3570 TaxID=2963522 RepID=UPI0021B840FB|nr:hypothetical protein [Bacillus sp. Marseille-Q3570]